MAKEMNPVKRDRPPPVSIDDVDRKLLRLLAEDATRKYAELGEAVHLTAPAVHERVKRLKRDGVITGTVATLDGKKIGCPLLAFIHVDTDGWGLTDSVLELGGLADVEEIHSAAGDTCVILKVRMRGTQDLEALLARIYRFEGVRSIRSHVVLNTYLERGPKPEIEIGGSAE
ncbi:Lrp/AsnC family transcriptional regulator [Pelagibius litoralis]|uniref:Lrp/AsnC family transcriptional regulator n=1 Tax=Pelagibius litoralis TaxID=374515 RepID=A0A967EZI0_9PROT|nr:Lrp/AsnC family transcriptional regulator [Pelagibius litoralis]NIA70338.1 Lrp/AsnC family transcriptional regulator [Pelagibius litoralis]